MKFIKISYIFLIYGPFLTLMNLMKSAISHSFLAQKTCSRFEGHGYGNHHLYPCPSVPIPATPPGGTHPGMPNLCIFLPVWEHIDRLHAHSFKFALEILWLIICMVVLGLQELLHIFFGRIRINARA